MNYSPYFNLNHLSLNFIKGLNSVIFLFVLSTGALVLPSMLPLTTFLGILLLIVGFTLNLSSSLGGVKENNRIDFFDHINYSNILLPVLSLCLLFLLVLSRFYTPNFNFISSFASLVLHVIFFVFIVNTREYLLIYLKSYIYFIFLMAAGGLIALALVYIGFVDTESNFVNIYELTDGAFRRDVGSTDSYIFPYNLGFILTGSGKLNLLGFSFYRISGWAHEPTSATLFIAPAMILLLHSKIVVKNWIRVSLFTVIATFWFFAMSLGSFFAFTMLYFFYVITTLFIKVFPLKLSVFIVFSVLVLSLLSLFYFDELIKSSFLVSKLDFQSQTFQNAISRLTWFMPHKAYTQVHSFGFMMAYSIMFVFLCAVIHSLFIQKDFNPYALIVLYIIMHTMKGSQDSVYLLPYAFFWFYVLHFSIPNNQTKSVKSSIYL